MRNVRARFGALVVATAVALPATVAVADEVPEENGDGSQLAVDVAIEEIGEVAAEADIDPDVILGAEIELALPDEYGEPTEVRLTVEEALVRLLGRAVIDTESNGGYLGLPITGAGNLLHTYVNVAAGAHSPLPVDSPNLPELPDTARYDVIESGYTPDTPILPIINPLLLLGGVADLPELPDTDLSVLSQPLLAAHWGGRLKNVQGSDWTTGFHSAGTTVIGSSVNTEDRSDDPDADLPIWVPFVEDGALTIPDSSIDFTGFALVTEGGACERIVVTLPFIGQRVIGYFCITVGVLLGDGVAFFDDEAPLDVRSTLAPIWEPVPPPLDEVIAVVDEVLQSLPIGDVLDLIDLPEVPEVPTALASVAPTRILTGLLRMR